MCCCNFKCFYTLQGSLTPLLLILGNLIADAMSFMAGSLSPLLLILANLMIDAMLCMAGSLLLILANLMVDAMSLSCMAGQQL